LQAVYESGEVATTVTGPEATQTAADATTVPLESVAERVNVFPAVTCTVVLPVVAGVTGPTPWSMASESALETVQARVTLPPPTGRLAGVAVKLVMLGSDPQLQAGRNSPAASSMVRSLMVSPSWSPLLSVGLKGFGVAVAPCRYQHA
jgi:hypothetical protein